MTLNYLDWIIIASYLVFAIGVGIYLSKRASRNIGEFFASGGKLPWWVVGTSMVATTFAVDTPLAITEIIAEHGIAGNWIWWNMAIAHGLAVFVFARFWRRANILTDLEMLELRYSGKSATVLRVFRAFWEGLLFNAIVIGWVLFAMSQIITVIFGDEKLIHALPLDSKWQYILLCLLVSVVYSLLSGFWGVVITDLVQFVIAMTGSIVLAVIAVDHVGGMDALLKSPEISGKLSFIPSTSSASLPLVTLISFLSVFWWASKNADSGGYMAQRMIAAKNEKHSVLAMLWFSIAHYALRPWPWILVALVSLVLYPNLTDPALGYPKLVVELLPTGLKGLMVASFVAAFMSTVDTHVNWGSSYLINDFYKRLIVKKASNAHYVMISRLSGLFIMIFAGLLAYFMESVLDSWKFLFTITMGIGGVYIVRWFWWRVNAWSEISAWIGSALAYTVLYLLGIWYGIQLEFGWKLIIIAFSSTTVWILVTYLTPPVDEKRLMDFYTRVRPAIRGWKRIAHQVDPSGSPGLTWKDLLAGFAGILLVYFTLFSIGNYLFNRPIEAYISFGGVVLAGLGVYLLTRHRLE